MSTRIQHVEPAPCSNRVPVIDLCGLSHGNGHCPITEREVRAIVEVSDPVVRNLRITLGYHDLLLGMARLLGVENMTWPAFACWASRTAGSFIRGEYIPTSVQLYLDKLRLVHGGLHTVHRLLTGVRREQPLSRSLLVDIVDRVSREVTVQISWGNHMVFEDIAPLYARMIETFGTATSYDARAIERFLGRLRPGSVHDGGQDLLIAAFRSYYQAMFEPDRKTKAELVLLGNNLVGFHEQSRLQPAIEKSLNAPIAELIAKTAHARAHELTHRRMHGWIDRQIDRLLAELSDWMQREWQRIATSWFMYLQLPDKESHGEIVAIDGIKVGVDVPPRCERFDFPPELARLGNVHLKALLYDLDKTPNRLEDSRAKCWARLEDRMDYLVDLFRTKQQDITLYRQPFTDRQVGSIRAGDIPPGCL